MALLVSVISVSCSKCYASKEFLMKIIVILFLVLLNSCFACSQTQYEINMSAFSERKKADSALNSVANRILKNFKDDKIFINNFNRSQKIWRQFFEAEMDLKYPKYPSEVDGSSSSMCWNFYWTQLVDERIKKLMEYLVGIKEGDVCRGSVPSEYEIIHGR